MFTVTRNPEKKNPGEISGVCKKIQKIKKQKPKKPKTNQKQKTYQKTEKMKKTPGAAGKKKAHPAVFRPDVSEDQRFRVFQ